MKMENLKLQEKLDKMESVRSKETLIEKDKNIQVSPNPKILGDIRNVIKILNIQLLYIYCGINNYKKA